MPPRYSSVRILAYVIPLIFGFYVAFRIVAFVRIFGRHEGRILTQPEVLQAYESRNASTNNHEYIPRVIHQIFHNWTDPDNETLPAHWSAPRQTCIDLHQGWEHKLWTVRTSRQFLEKEYPWFLKTYDDYQLPIQKIDALRYFLLRHFGGIYIDADNGCRASMTPLLYYPAFVVDGGRGALSNDILGGAPDHPYWILMTENLISYAWNYPFPYITISYASGQWYETEVWNAYYKTEGGGRGGEAADAVRVSVDSRVPEEMQIFWFHTQGGSWNNWDNRLFDWIGRNLALFFAGIFAGIAVLVLLGTALLRVCRKSFVRENRYAREEEGRGGRKVFASREDEERHGLLRDSHE